MFFVENCGNYSKAESIPFPAEGAVYHLLDGSGAEPVLFELADGSVFTDEDVMPE